LQQAAQLEATDQITPPAMSSTPTAFPVPLTVIDTNTTPWQPFPVPYLNVNLDHNPLHHDEESGMTILKLQYKKGFTNPVSLSAVRDARSSVDQQGVMMRHQWSLFPTISRLIS
jgi:hypothetical protein